MSLFQSTEKQRQSCKINLRFSHTSILCKPTKFLICEKARLVINETLPTHRASTNSELNQSPINEMNFQAHIPDQERVIHPKSLLHKIAYEKNTNSVRLLQQIIHLRKRLQRATTTFLLNTPIQSTTLTVTNHPIIHSLKCCLYSPNTRATPITKSIS